MLTNHSFTLVQISVLPNKEMALGCYYLTSLPDIAESIPDDKLPAFSNEKEAIVAYQTRKIILWIEIK